MDEIFWIPIGVIVVGLLLGTIVGARSRTGSVRTGALVGLGLAVMATFPLWAIGLSNA